MKIELEVNLLYLRIGQHQLKIDGRKLSLLSMR